MRMTNYTNSFLNGFASFSGYSKKRKFDLDVTRQAWKETGQFIFDAMKDLKSSDERILRIKEKLGNVRR